MKYAFTDRTRHVLARARDEANGLGHDDVGTEHILLGLLREGEGVAGQLLKKVRGGAGAIRARVEGAVRRGASTRAWGDLPYTSRAKKVLEYAMAEARALGHAHVGTEHLLLGLLREEKGVAGVVLMQSGFQLDATRDAVGRVLRGEVAGLADVVGDAVVEAEPVWFLEIDAGDGRPIYEQIIAGIEEAVATGRLVAGERLPSVRDLAGELGVAPGTVARAYSALEQRGVLVTEGARGTHVADVTPAAREEEMTAALEALLRPVAVAAYHMGATAQRVVEVLERVMRGILSDANGEGRGAA